MSVLVGIPVHRQANLSVLHSRAEKVRRAAFHAASRARNFHGGQELQTQRDSLLQLDEKRSGGSGQIAQSIFLQKLHPPLALVAVHALFRHRRVQRVRYMAHEIPYVGMQALVENTTEIVLRGIVENVDR